VPVILCTTIYAAKTGAQVKGAFRAAADSSGLLCIRPARARHPAIAPMLPFTVTTSSCLFSKRSSQRLISARYRYALAKNPSIPRTTAQGICQRRFKSIRPSLLVESNSHLHQSDTQKRRESTGAMRSGRAFPYTPVQLPRTCRAKA